MAYLIIQFNDFLKYIASCIIKFAGDLIIYDGNRLFAVNSDIFAYLMV